VNKIIQLREDNNVLKKHIFEMSEQYYHWKVACILTVDRNRQITIEMDKINKEYREHNMIRDFGLTSWAHTDELFPWTDIPTKKVGNLHIIDLAKCGRTTKMPHPRTTFKESHQRHCSLIPHNLFLMEPCARFTKMGLVQRGAWLSRGRFRTDGRSDDGRGGVRDLDAL
jgi:hypothetical protein